MKLIRDILDIVVKLANIPSDNKIHSLMDVNRFYTDRLNVKKSYLMN
jgi:hypothetical protein